MYSNEIILNYAKNLQDVYNDLLRADKKAFIVFCFILKYRLKKFRFLNFKETIKKGVLID
jgi:hypothetical protein